MMPPALRPGRLALIFGMAIGLFACERPPQEASTSEGSCPDRPVRMAVASSLRDVTEELRETLRGRPDPVEVEPVYGASSMLARQLALGAPIDVFVSADAGIVEDLVDRDLLDGESAFEFARGRLVLIGREHAFATDAGATDAGPDVFASPGFERIAIPSPAVPLGRYATSWLRSQGRLATLAGRIVRTESARATLAAVNAGRVDLAIVYESDLRFSRNVRLLGRIDPAEHPPIRYVAARTRTAADCPGTRSALEAWRNPETQRQLEKAGFRAADPEGPATAAGKGD